MTWTPKKGDPVKLTAAKPGSGPLLIRRARVTKVTPSGYVSIDALPHDRFQTAETGVWTPRKSGAPDYLKTITPITDEEADLLPDTDLGGRQFARSLKTKET